MARTGVFHWDSHASATGHVNYKALTNTGAGVAGYFNVIIHQGFLQAINTIFRYRGEFEDRTEQARNRAQHFDYVEFGPAQWQYQYAVSTDGNYAPAGTLWIARALEPFRFKHGEFPEISSTGQDNIENDRRYYNAVIDNIIASEGVDFFTRGSQNYKLGSFQKIIRGLVNVHNVPIESGSVGQLFWWDDITNGWPVWPKVYSDLWRYNWSGFTPPSAALTKTIVYQHRWRYTFEPTVVYEGKWDQHQGQTVFIGDWQWSIETPPQTVAEWEWNYETFTGHQWLNRGFARWRWRPVNYTNLHDAWWPWKAPGHVVWQSIFNWYYDHVQRNTIFEDDWHYGAYTLIWQSFFRWWFFPHLILYEGKWDVESTQGEIYEGRWGYQEYIDSTVPLGSPITSPQPSPFPFQANGCYELCVLIYIDGHTLVAGALPLAERIRKAVGLPYTDDRCTFRAYYWIGPLPNRHYPTYPTLHAGDWHHIWPAMQSRFSQLLQDPRYSIAFRAEPSKLCVLNEKPGWRYDDWQRNAEDRWEMKKIQEETEAAEEIATPGIDKPIWKAFARAIGWFHNLEFLGYNLRELFPDKLPQNQPQRHDIAAKEGELWYILDQTGRNAGEFGQLTLKAYMRTLQWQVNMLEYAIDEDLDADEVLFNLNHWIQGPKGNEAINSAMALAGALGALKTLDTAIERQEGLTGTTTPGFVLTFSEVLDIMHLIADQEELAGAIDVEGYLQGLSETERARILGSQIKGLGHYLKKREKQLNDAAELARDLVDAESGPTESAEQEAV